MLEAFGNIWHQGTVYEATAVAVPFLLEVLAGPHCDQVELSLPGASDGDIRRASVRVLSVAEDRAHASRSLEEQLAAETDPVVRATIVLAGLEVDAPAWREAARRRDDGGLPDRPSRSPTRRAELDPQSTNSHASQAIPSH